MSKDHDEEELNAIAGADFAEWDRIESEVSSNQDLMTDIRLLRERYGLPCTTLRAHLDWLSHLGNSQGIEAITQYQDDIAALVKKYGFDNDKGKQTIQSLIEFGKRVQSKVGSLGFPALQAVYKDGEFIAFRPVIGTDTAIHNPIVLKVLRDEQRDFLMQSDPPPAPQPMIDNPRKLDWRPLWEWHKRHPDVTLNEIAKKLNYNPVTVRRKLAELDSDK